MGMLSGIVVLTPFVYVLALINRDHKLALLTVVLCAFSWVIWSADILVDLRKDKPPGDGASALATIGLAAPSWAVGFPVLLFGPEHAAAETAFPLIYLPHFVSCVWARWIGRPMSPSNRRRLLMAGCAAFFLLAASALGWTAFFLSGAPTMPDAAGAFGWAVIAILVTVAGAAAWVGAKLRKAADAPALPHWVKPASPAAG